MWKIYVHIQQLLFYSNAIEKHFIHIFVMLYQPNTMWHCWDNWKKNLKPLWRRLLWCSSTFVVVKKCLTVSHYVSFCLIMSHIVKTQCLTMSTLSHFVSKCLMLPVAMRHFETLRSDKPCVIAVTCQTCIAPDKLLLIQQQQPQQQP